MNESETKRRQAERIPFEIRVMIRTQAGEIPARADSRNISLAGIYLVPEQSIALETPCTVDMTINGPSSTMTLSVSGIVCRHDSQGTAIAFVDMDEGVFLHIKNLARCHDCDTARHSPCDTD